MLAKLAAWWAGTSVTEIVWLCVVLTIIIVQILQEFGMYIARRTDRRART